MEKVLHKCVQKISKNQQYKSGIHKVLCSFFSIFTTIEYHKVHNLKMERCGDNCENACLNLLNY